MRNPPVTNRGGCTFCIITVHFTVGEMKNLVGIQFFISLLTLLSGIILIDGALTKSKAVAKKLVFSWIAGQFEGHIIPTKNSSIS